jgi:hypothetical protein
MVGKNTSKRMCEGTVNNNLMKARRVIDYSFTRLHGKAATFADGEDTLSDLMLKSLFLPE